jgi:20S proteasome alpha/beta subunit
MLTALGLADFTLACLPPARPGELSGDNIEVAVVGEDRKFRVLTPSEVQDYLREVE